MLLSDEDLKQVRAMARRGSSAAALVAFIKKRNPSAKRSQLAGMVQQAFALSSGQTVSIASTQSYGSGTRPDSDLEFILLPRIVATFEKWGADNIGEPSCWCSNLEVSNNDELVAEALRTRCGMSEQGWDDLSEEDRRTVRDTESTRLMLSEIVVLMSKLIEALQAQVD